MSDRDAPLPSLEVKPEAVVRRFAEYRENAARHIESLEAEIASLKRALEHHAPKSCPVCTQVRLLVSPNEALRREAMETIQKGIALMEKLG